MNQPLFLHIVEKLEGFLGKLPATIQKPILHELTPLKELFLQQRPPRFVFVGSSKLPLAEILPALIGFAAEENRNALMEIFRWLDLKMDGQGTITVLDARGADESAIGNIRDELKSQAADIFFFVDDGDASRPPRKREIENLAAFLEWNEEVAPGAKVIGVSLFDPARNRAKDGGTRSAAAEKQSTKLGAALEEKPSVRTHLAGIMAVPLGRKQSTKIESETEPLLALITQHLPNQARVEMLRISRDRTAQTEVAQVLVKSTTAICAAIGAQPIPLADLPILTTLQLVMVSGIMYLSGRERSLRAATEFMGALGANVGAGMLLREGTRAFLKFFPGWGNVVCGMVAGCGNLRDRSGCDRLLHRRRLAEGRETNLSGQSEKAFRFERGNQGFRPLNKL